LRHRDVNAQMVTNWQILKMISVKFSIESYFLFSWTAIMSCTYVAFL